MNRNELQSTILRILRHLAPEADLGTLPLTGNLREELDLDSVDFLNFAIALNKELGVEVPEADYRRLSTLQSCLDYLEGRVSPETNPGTSR